MSRLSLIWDRTNQWLAQAGFQRDWNLILLAAVIGTMSGVVAAGFETLVEASGHFFFVTLGEREFKGSEWLFVVLLPAIGGLGVGLIHYILKRPTPEHGVPEVIEAMARRDRELPTSRGVTKAVTASLTIGSGGSAGVEAPIIMIGSVVGAAFSRMLRVSREHKNTLIGCGAAAGMAAIFNAPIAGVLFVLEVMLRDFSIRTFMPIVVAAVFGTAIMQGLLPEEVVFAVPEAMRTYEFAFSEILPYAILGIVCGIVGVGFVRLMKFSELSWARVPLPSWAKPMTGGVVLGLLGLVFLLMPELLPGYDRPAFYGNGYPVIESLLNPQSYPPAPGSPEPSGSTPPESTPPKNTPGHAAPAAWPGSPPDTMVPGAIPPGAILPGAIEPDPTAPLQHATPIATATIPLLLAVLVFKLIGTAMTLGSGGSGGIIAPSLFVGATLGGLMGTTLQTLDLFPGATPATYALAGMAGLIAAVLHCPLTAFLMVFEITQDYKVVLPMMLVAILATTCSQFFQRDSIYQAWLRQHGIRMGTYADMMLLRRLSVSDVPLSPAVIVHPDEPAQRLIDLAEDYAVVDYAVCDENDSYLGMVIGQDVRTTLLQREAIPLMIVGELMRNNLPTCDPDEALDRVLDKFSEHDVSSLVVVDSAYQAKGMITRARLMKRYQRLLEE